MIYVAELSTGYLEWSLLDDQILTELSTAFLKVQLLVYWERLKQSSSNFECGLPRVESTFTVNLLPFGSCITEPQMHENCDFVVSVNMSNFLGLHDTLPCVS